ncbi:glycosyltransferase [Pelagibaculum spongiae]|uniref:Uncharacterized protein n=1 Tax=Pelagibaculum spongiae TaxID=2080658 RepID=A0A2V1H161_9GAMM|nr:glycosyltransferase [Pelagibaculum spongiae]PVZ72223.1 hypothetical protein DC094_04200 [Pelagibaculum spongiae]
MLLERISLEAKRFSGQFDGAAFPDLSKMGEGLELIPQQILMLLDKNNYLSQNCGVFFISSIDFAMLACFDCRSYHFHHGWNEIKTTYLSDFGQNLMSILGEIFLKNIMMAHKKIHQIINDIAIESKNKRDEVEASIKHTSGVAIIHRIWLGKEVSLNRITEVLMSDLAISKIWRSFETNETISRDVKFVIWADRKLLAFEIPKYIAKYFLIYDLESLFEEFKFSFTKSPLVSHSLISAARVFILRKQYATATDILRMMVLYLYGGLYLDFEFERNHDITGRYSLSFSPSASSLRLMQSCRQMTVSKNVSSDFLISVNKKIEGAFEKDCWNFCESLENTAIYVGRSDHRWVRLVLVCIYFNISNLDEYGPRGFFYRQRQSDFFGKKDYFNDDQGCARIATNISPSISAFLNLGYYSSIDYERVCVNISMYLKKNSPDILCDFSRFLELPKEVAFLNDPTGANITPGKGRAAFLLDELGVMKFANKSWKARIPPISLDD